MPSFDIVSEVDWQEVSNAVNQAAREVDTRYDFKGSDARIEQADPVLTLYADDDYKVGQVREILQMRLAKRGVDLGCLEHGTIRKSPTGRAMQPVTVRQGIDTELARRIVKLVKASKLRVQAAIQGPQVRVSGKKRDDLQQVIALLKGEKLGMPLQFTNFRD